jgi:alpha-L-fucosidase
MKNRTTTGTDSEKNYDAYCCRVFLIVMTALLGGRLALASGEFGVFVPSKAWTPPKDPAVLKKLSEWQDRKLGLLIHWGTYSQWGIVESWTLTTVRHEFNARPPRLAHLDDRAYMGAYENLITAFNPTQFDPDKWAVTAKDAGIKYMIITTKHHDGFCMWDTATTDYKITSPRCPFHSDPRADAVKRICEAFRRQGLSTGLYFSKADWHCPHYWLPELGPGAGQGPNYDPSSRPEEWREFKDYTWRQIEELMAGYGPQDVLWLDGGAVRPPHAGIDMDGLAAMARKYQPGLIVVDRTVHGRNENYITPEGHIPTHYLPYPWETCDPMGTAWTYKPNDRFKSAGELIKNLCRIVARGGNYLIGIGPDGGGEYDYFIYKRLEAMGAWLKLNGEAIYETRPVKPYEQGDCVFTRKRDGTMYAIVLANDDNSSLPESVTLPKELAAKTAQVELLGYGVLPTHDAEKIVIPRVAVSKPPCSYAWVLRLTAKKPPAKTVERETP